MKKKEYNPELYTSEELDAVESHIEKFFGKVEKVFHELYSPDIHCDVELIDPTPERNYYTLVTVGMGAHRMNIPERLLSNGIDRAELIICLPPDWDFKSKDDNYTWPLNLIKYLARLPGDNNTWLGYGHTVPTGKLAANTDLSGCILLGIQDAPEGAAVCALPDAEQILFYQVIPLYEEEMNFKVENGTDALLEYMEDVDHVVDIKRQNIFS